MSEKLMEQAMSANVQALRKAAESRSDDPREGERPKGLGYRQTGVYSQASERQKANSGL